MCEKLFQDAKLWRENIDICIANGLTMTQIPKSHIEIHKGEKLLKVLYNQESLNFYLKGLFKISS